MTDPSHNKHGHTDARAAHPSAVRVVAGTSKGDAPEPFPIVDFLQAQADASRETATWMWGAIVYGTGSSSNTEPIRVGDVVTLEEDVDTPVQLLVDGEVVAEGTLVLEDSRIGIRISRVLHCESPDGGRQEVIEDAA